MTPRRHHDAGISLVEVIVTLALQVVPVRVSSLTRVRSQRVMKSRALRFHFTIILSTVIAVVIAILEEGLVLRLLLIARM